MEEAKFQKAKPHTVGKGKFTIRILLEINIHQNSNKKNEKIKIKKELGECGQELKNISMTLPEAVHQADLNLHEFEP